VLFPGNGRDVFDTHFPGLSDTDESSSSSACERSMEPASSKRFLADARTRRTQVYHYYRMLAPLALVVLVFGLTVLHQDQQSGGLHPTLVLDALVLDRSIASLRNLSQMFHVVSESVVYSRYARVYSRRLRHPDGKEFDYDVWGRNWKNDSFAVVCVVPFDAKDLSFTLIREYNIAHSMHVYSFPQGCYEQSKHASPQVAAEAELDEEARLRCQPSSWITLLDVSAGSPQDKFQREKVHYFLCTDSTPLTEGVGRERDAEEDINIERRVSVAQLKALMRSGVMQSNNIAAGMLAIDRLRHDGLLPIEA
jgi:8-oxo-dGTP pyrophosphatase MutT (NUDIX family)